MPRSKCPKCGMELPENRMDGLCPKCVLESLATDSRSDVKPSPNGATPPFRFGDYELLEQIGRGGMGVVYKARNLKLGVLVALKRILHADAATPQELDRLRIEAETAANCRHPNIVAVHEFGDVDGEYYFTMDLIHGTNLAQKIAQKEFAIPETRAKGNKAQCRLTQVRIAKLMVTAARAIYHAHQRHFLHRDLTPSNILVDANDQPFITDFGVAKALSPVQNAVSSSHVVGKPSYMSPEQASGKMIGVATDIYGLGAILYELLTGRPPFRGTTPLETLRLVTEQEATNPSSCSEWVDQDLASICLKCLEKDPGHRYATAQDLAEDLERWLQQKPITARRAGLVKRTGRWIRRNPIGATLILTLLVGLTTSLLLNKAKIRAQAAEIKAKEAEISARKAILAQLDVGGFWDSSKAAVTIPHNILDLVTGTKQVAIPLSGHKLYTLGILAEEEPVENAYGYARLLQYLENNLGAGRTNVVHFGLRLYKRNQDAIDGLLQGDVEILKIGGNSYLQARMKDPGICPLVSQHPPKQGVIFTREDSGISHLEDLVGKSVVFGDTNSTISAWAGYHLVQAGVSGTNLKRFEFLDSIAEYERNKKRRESGEPLSSHTLAIEAVKTNGYDAGVASQKQFQDSGKKLGLVAIKEFPSDPVFLVVGTNFSPLIAQDLKRTLLALRDRSIFTGISARIISYREASDKELNPLREAMQTVERHFRTVPLRTANNIIISNQKPGANYEKAK